MERITPTACRVTVTVCWVTPAETIERLRRLGDAALAREAAGIVAKEDDSLIFVNVTSEEA